MQKVRREAVRPVVGYPALHDSAFPRSLILLIVELDQQTESRAFGESRASLSSGGILGQKARIEEKVPTWLLVVPGRTEAFSSVLVLGEQDWAPLPASVSISPPTPAPYHFPLFLRSHKALGGPSCFPVVRKGPPRVGYLLT